MHHRKVQIAGDGRHAAVDHALLLDAVPLHQEEVAGRGSRYAPAARRPCALLARQTFGDLALETAAQPDEALRVLREEVLVDARLVVEAFRVARRHELDEVVVTLGVFREQDEVVRRFARAAVLAQAAARRHVHLAAQDRVDAALPRMVVEDHRREHVPVFRDRHRRHLQRHRLVQHLVDAARAVQQRELGVQVKMDELSHCLFPLIVDGAS